MNDLFATSSFKKYTDLKQQSRLDDMESGSLPCAVNLDEFFEDVENVKSDLRSLEQLYRRLQDSNEETKTAHNAKAIKDLRSSMDSDIGSLLRLAKSIRSKLEALDKSNTACRNTVPGCGPGSSADRTRTSVVGGLGKKLKDLMDDFQGLRARMNEEYKEAVGRRIYTVTGQRADEETVERMISSGESEDFIQRVIQEQQGGRGVVMEAVREMQERHDAVREIEKGLLELHQVFLDMAALVESQGQHLNDIESHVAHASSFVRRGTVELVVAKEYQKSSRKWACIAVLLGVVFVIVLFLPILPSLLNL